MRISTLRRSAILVASLVVLLTAYASAATVKLSDSTVGTNGGPFEVTVTNGSVGKYSATGNSTFYTFCVEVYEDFYPGYPYYTVVSDRTQFGTNSTLQQPVMNPTDPTTGYVMLQYATAYLYSNYMAGTMQSVLSTWTKTPTAPTGSIQDLQALQDAIWILQGYAGFQQGTDPAKAEALTLVTNAQNAGWTNIGNVRVMQMWYSDTLHNEDTKSQDQLVLVPTPTASMAGLSLLGGLGLVGWIKRRRNVLD